MPANDVLQDVKLRLRFNSSGLDDFLQPYITEIGARIRHYCNLEEIPIELEAVWASMTVDAYRAEQSEAVKDVKIGDTSVKTSGYVMKSSLDDLVYNYRIDLNRYRKMRW